MSNAADRLECHPVLRALSEAHGGRDTMCFTGFVGPSPTDAVRLHRELALDAVCLEIGRSDVVAVSEQPDGHGRVLLHVRADATVALCHGDTAETAELRAMKDDTTPNDRQVAACTAEKFRKCVEDAVLDGKSADRAIGGCSANMTIFRLFCEIGSFSPGGAGSVLTS